jgi:nuclear transport factor 2 (NTF2) superfamily protein
VRSSFRTRIELADYIRDPKVVAQAYTPDSIWRNRTCFIVGTAAIEELLAKKWEKEKNYRLRKELFAFTDNKIAVQFWYEFQDAHDGMKWKRCYGLEDWTFAEDGKMRKRQMSGNDVGIAEAGEYWRFSNTSSDGHSPSQCISCLTFRQIAGTRRVSMSTKSRLVRRIGEYACRDSLNVVVKSHVWRMSSNEWRIVYGYEYEFRICLWVSS